MSLVTESEIIHQFKVSMLEHGINTNDPIITDGELHRFHIEGDSPRSKNGAYILHLDGRPAGYFENFKTGIKQKWKAEGEYKPISRNERVRIQQQQTQKEATKNKRYAKAAAIAQQIYDMSTTENVRNHPYVKNKSIIPSGGIRIYQGGMDTHYKKYIGCLVIPVLNENNQLQSLQFIAPNKRFSGRNKDNLNGGKILGGFSPMGEEPINQNSYIINITEGWATACTVFSLTKDHTVTAFGTSGLKTTAIIYRKRYPNAEIRIIGDRGAEKYAIDAAKAVNGTYLIPNFCRNILNNKELTDFNDLFIAIGEDLTKEQLDKKLKLNHQLETQVKASPSEIIKQVINNLHNDVGLAYEPNIIAALQTIYRENIADYYRYRNQLKTINKDVLIAQIDRLVLSDQGNAESTNTLAEEIIDLIKLKVELFHNTDGEGYAEVEQNGHKENWPLNSRGFTEWLGQQVYQLMGKATSETTIKTVLLTLNGAAKYDGKEYVTYLRTAPYKNGYIIDLCNEHWQVIQITPQGWKLLDNAPVKFWRNGSMRPLSRPDPNSTIKDLERLWQHINIASKDQELILAWWLECFRPETSFTILEFVGEQGCAKSTTQYYLRELIDPNKSNLRTAPKNVEDVFIAANCNWLVSFNNLSRLSTALQDALCNLATGGGFATRTLYTNTEETTLDIKRPVILNGISALATAPDLVDRIIHIEPPRIKNYRTEQQLQAAFEEDKPFIMGALFNLLAKTLKALPNIKIDQPPRMADFAYLGEAMFKALGRTDTFLTYYKENRSTAIIRTLDNSPIACAVLDYMQDHPMGYSGLVKHLLEHLTKYQHESDAWPKSPRGLADVLRRYATALRVANINIQFDPQRRIDGIHVSLTRVVNVSN